MLRGVSVTLTIAMVLASSALADQWERESLAGLEGLAIWIDVQGQDGFDTYVSKSDLQTVAQSKLRQNRIPIVDSADFPKSESSGLLNVLVWAMPVNDGDDVSRFAMYLRVEVSQPAIVKRGAGEALHRYATTWERSRLLVYGTGVLEEGGLRTEVTQLLDELMNDWRAANQD